MSALLYFLKLTLLFDGLKYNYILSCIVKNY